MPVASTAVFWAVRTNPTSNFFLVAAGALALTVLITAYQAAHEPSILAKGHQPAHT